MPPKLIKFRLQDSPLRLASSVRRVVIAEGKTTGEVVLSLLGDAKHAEEFVVIDGGGVSDLRSTIPIVAGRFQERILDAVAVVRDAERSAARAAAQSVEDALAKTEWPTASQASSRGWLLPGRVFQGLRARRLGVFILPDNESEGMIETLLVRSLGQRATACIEDYLNCMDAAPNHRDKARCLAYLAATADKKHHDSIGDALRAKRFQLDHECFEPLKRFLTELDQ